MPRLGHRRYKCPRCDHICYICSDCDRGQIYCGPACAALARADGVRDARRRHGRSDLGRASNRLRQAAFRARRQDSVTDQAPPEPPPPATLVMAASTINGARGAATEIVCACCGAWSTEDFVRLDFIRRRGRVGRLPSRAPPEVT